MFDYRMEHICSYSAMLANPPEVIGPVPEGIRANFYVTGGKVTGPRLWGRLRPVGADWLTIRPDGIGILDVRTTLETDDGALIFMAYSGVTDLGSGGYENFLTGHLPQRLKLSTAPRLSTAHPDFVWLNRLQCVAVGEADLQTFTVRYDVYSLT
jgi:hypothetical protein